VHLLVVSNAVIVHVNVISVLVFLAMSWPLSCVVFFCLSTVSLLQSVVGFSVVWSVRADWLLDIEDALSIYMAIGTGRFKTWRHRMHKLAIYGN